MVRKWSPRHSEREPAAAPSWNHQCPACGRFEHVEKASSVVNRNSGTVLVGNTPYPYVSTLASMLSLPAAPRTAAIGALAWTVLVSWLAGSVLALVIALLLDQSRVSLPDKPLSIAMTAVVAILGFALPLAALARYLWTNHRAKRLFPRWSEARQRWSKLYYCSWDDVVFLRDEDDFETPDRVSALLFRQERESVTVPSKPLTPAPEPEAVAAS